MVNYWIAALKEFNKNKPSWCMPRKGTSDHKEMIKIMASLKNPTKDKPDKPDTKSLPKNRPDIIRYVIKGLDREDMNLLNGFKKSTADKMMNDYYDYFEANSEKDWVNRFSRFYFDSGNKYKEKGNPWDELPKQKRVKLQQNKAVLKRSAMKKMNDVEKELLNDIPVNEREDFIDSYIDYLEDNGPPYDFLRWGDVGATFYYYFYNDGRYKMRNKYEPLNN